jgi:Domain of unknown function (DUF4234)
MTSPQQPPTPPPPPPYGRPTAQDGVAVPGSGQPPDGHDADGRSGHAPEAYAPYDQPGQAPQGSPQPGYVQPAHLQQPPSSGFAGQPMPGAPTQYATPQGPPGRRRPTGMTMLLFFVTLGIWGFIYYFQTQEEMRRHSGQGLGGVLALVIAIVFGVASPFFLSHEVGQLYERRGWEKPVSAVTALWFFPGILILVGPFIWFIRTNNALNEYWQSLGVRETSLM